MSLPYFTRGQRVFDRGMPEGLMLLLFPDAVKLLSPTLKRPLNEFPNKNLKSLLSGLQFAMGQIVLREPGKAVQGDKVWQEVVEAVFELLALVVPLGKADELYELYVAIMEPLAEAQQELYNWDAQIKGLADADEEVLYNAYMGKYSALYEGLVKVAVSLAVYCIDIISAHKDIGKKDPEGYVHDDLSYKRSKILEAAKLGLRTDLAVLLTGVEPHIRNAIAHKRFEYGEGGRVTFRDIDRKTGAVTFERTMPLGSFKLLVKSLEVNFVAQGAALILFPFEYADRITARTGAPSKPKALKAAIYHECQEVKLEPTEIELKDGHLTCKLYRSSSLDRPSQIFGNMDGIRFGQEIPPLPLRDQLLGLAVRLAEMMAPITVADLQAVDHAGDSLGYVKMDLAGLSNAMKGPPFPPLETFVIESDFGSDTGGEAPDNPSPEE